MTRRTMLIVSVLLTHVLGVFSPEASAQDHDRFLTQPTDHRFSFEAFVLSFDGDDDDVAMAVPEWVAYELRKTPDGLGSPPNRPSKWATDEDLFELGIAPNDDSYRNSGYSRGHMAMKSHAFRTSAGADRETHTVLNACPQVQSMNAGVWLSLENLTGEWADAYGAVWIVCGPVFYANQPIEWIGDSGEIPVAIPHAFYKVVVKEGDAPDEFDVLSFLIPMYGDEDHAKQTADVRPYLTSVDTIEALTGLDFLSLLEDSVESDLERSVFTKLWPTAVLASSTPSSVPSPESVTRESQPAPAVERDPYAEISLRRGITASPAEILLAKKIRAAGWMYIMPRPKSNQARWGNSDGRTTWWHGYWENRDERTYSRSTPAEADGFRGDGIHDTGWRRGGSPRRPSAIEWLCSVSGGPG